ncbi:phytanoyl-CoA dioxygenase family protein [Streptomyces sp. NBC_00191]|uniref:phytanoyl-CoA dioxygenase family protein n=1 Tax=Streptomyces sp. NBC_00191 TaxID=2975674 RepID=UPI00324B8E2B
MTHHVTDAAVGTLEDCGFLPLPGLVPAAGLARLRRAAAQLRKEAAHLDSSAGDFVLEAAGVGGWVAWQQGDPQVAGLLRSVSRAHHYAPDLAALQDELDLPEGLVPQLVGAPGVLVNSFLWAKPPRLGSEKPWHQDMAFAPEGFDTEAHSVVTVWVAVEEATEANGCLQFISGSHRHGLFEHRGDNERRPGEPPLADAVEPHVDPARVLPAPAPVSVPLPPGSAVAFDGMMLHRSAPNSTVSEPRTAISFVYRVPRPVWSHPGRRR